MVSVSPHVSPFLKRIESPGLNEEEFTLDMLFHGSEGDVPVLESFPVEEEI